MAAIFSIRSSSFFLLIISLISIVFFTSPCLSDPEGLQDFCVADTNGTISVNGYPCKPISQISSNDFFFSGLTKEGNTNNVFGSSATAGNVISFPGLNTLGISMNRVDFAPGGINPLHSHPRATETGVVLQGEVLVGFISSRNVFYSKVLKVGEMFVIPEGLVHFQKNVGTGKALLVTAFNSQMPGSVILPTTLFGTNPSIPSGILAQNFLVNETVINDIKSKFGG